MAAIGLVAGLAGSLVSAAGTIMGGKAAKADAYYQASQLEKKATEERAAGQREVFEQQKQTDAILSRQQAVAGASGFNALDPTVLDLAGDTVQESEYRKGMIKYGATERASGLTDQAKATRISGKAALKGSYFGAAGTILDGASNFYTKYAASKSPTTSSGSAPSLYGYGGPSYYGTYG